MPVSRGPSLTPLGARSVLRAASYNLSDVEVLRLASFLPAEVLVTDEGPCAVLDPVHVCVGGDRELVLGWSDVELAQ